MRRIPALVRPAIWLLLYGGLFAGVLVSYFSSYPIPEFKEKCAAILCALFLFLSMMAVGKTILDRFRIKSSVEDLPGFTPVLVVINAALGFGIIAFAVLLLGWLFPGALKSKLTLLAVVLGVFSIRLVLTERIRKISTPLSLSGLSLGELAAVFLAAGGMILSFLTCFSPITYYDSLVYHLALPALYSRLGGIQTITTNLYSFFPGNAEMMYLFILESFPAPEYIINLLGWGTSVGITLVLGQWAYEIGGRRQALMAAALWWTMPAVLLLTVGGYVDVILAGFVILAVRCFYLSQQKGDNPLWLALAGIFSGLAFATKYTGAIAFILLFIYKVASCLHRKEFSPRNIVLFSLMAFLPASPWLLKNTISIGNPVFPFFYQWLGGNVGWTHSSAAGYFSMLTEYGAKSNMIYELFIAPLKIAGSNLSFGGGFDVLGDFGWLLFVFGAPAAIFFLPKQPAVRFITAGFVGYFLIWFTTKPVLRFLIGGLPLAVILTSTTIENLIRQRGRNMKWVTGLLLGLCLLSNFFIYFFISDTIKPFSVALGLETRDEFLRRRLSFYPTYAHLNETLTSKHKTLLIGEQRTYHLEVPFISSNLFAPSPISEVTNNARDIDDLGRFLSSQGVTHILINEGEIERLGGLGKFGFNAHGSHLFGEFLNSRTVFLSSDRRVNLYSLKSDG